MDWNYEADTYPLQDAAPIDGDVLAEALRSLAQPQTGLTPEQFAADPRYAQFLARTDDTGPSLASIQPQVEQPAPARIIQQPSTTELPAYTMENTPDGRTVGTIAPTIRMPLASVEKSLEGENYIRNNSTGEVTLLSNPIRERAQAEEDTRNILRQARLQQQESTIIDMEGLRQKQAAALRAPDLLTKQSMLDDLTANITESAHQRIQALESQYKSKYSVNKIETALVDSITRDTRMGVRGMSEKTKAISTQLATIERSYKDDLNTAYRNDPILKQLQIAQKGLEPIAKQTAKLANAHENKMQTLAIMSPEDRMQVAVIAKDPDAVEMQVNDINKRSGVGTDLIKTDIRKMQAIVNDRDAYLQILEKMSQSSKEAKAQFILDRDTIKKQGAETWKQGAGSRLALANRYMTSLNETKLMNKVDSWFSAPDAAPVYEQIKASNGNKPVKMEDFVQEYVKGAPTPELRSKRLETIKTDMYKQIEQMNRLGYGSVDPQLVDRVSARVGVSDVLGGILRGAATLPFKAMSAITPDSVNQRMNASRQMLDARRPITDAENADNRRRTLEFLANLGR